MAKKIIVIVIVLLIVILASSCKEKDTKISLENTEHITGKVISVDEETFLMKSTYFKYPGTVMIPKRNKSEVEFKWQIGDELKVYFDGQFKETDPAQISSVVTIELIKSVTEKADDVVSEEDQTAEDSFLVFINGSSREMKENEVGLLYEASGGDYEKIEPIQEFDYEVLENDEIQFKFNSKENVLYISRSDITTKVPNEIGAVIKMALDGTL